MEEKINGEQPLDLEVNVQSEIVKEEEDGTALTQENDGSLGKFKDAQSLLMAYNNLQAEFTKKCQKLSEVSSLLEGQKQEQGKSEKVETFPVYESDDWKQNVSTFLKQNSEAKEYSGDIANEILKDKSLQSSPHALELAWARVMKDNYKNPQTLANDQNFINEKILSQEQVKKQVLDEYFKNLQNTKTPPVIAKTGVVAGIQKKEPTTMMEAKQMVEKLFNLKG